MLSPLSCGRGDRNLVRNTNSTMTQICFSKVGLTFKLQMQMRKWNIQKNVGMKYMKESAVSNIIIHHAHKQNEVLVLCLPKLLVWNPIEVSSQKKTKHSLFAFPEGTICPEGSVCLLLSANANHLLPHSKLHVVIPGYAPYLCTYIKVHVTDRVEGTKSSALNRGTLKCCKDLP